MRRTDLVEGEVYVLVDYPEYGEVSLYKNGSVEGEHRQAPIFFKKEPYLRIFCAEDVKVLAIDADKKV